MNVANAVEAKEDVSMHKNGNQDIPHFKVEEVMKLDELDE